MNVLFEFIETCGNVDTLVAVELGQGFLIQIIFIYFDMKNDSLKTRNIFKYVTFVLQRLITFIFHVHFVCVYIFLRYSTVAPFQSMFKN